MVHLQVKIGEFTLSRSRCDSEEQAAECMYEELQTFGISYEWETVDLVRKVSRGDGAKVDPRFPDYDVDDAIMMWDIRWADRFYAYSAL